MQVIKKKVGMKGKSRQKKKLSRKLKLRTTQIESNEKVKVKEKEKVKPKDELVKKKAASYNTGYDTGYTKGYQKARSDAAEILSSSPEFMKGFEDGFAKGRHSGGNGIVDSLLPEYQILPDIPIEEIIAAGLEKFRPQIIPLITAHELGDRLVGALNAKVPMSVIRLGDGELLTLAQDTVMPASQVREEGSFLTYAGIQVPDLEARDQLAQSIRRATIVGLPKLRVNHFQPLAYAAFRAHHIEYRELQLTDSLVNYYLYQAGYLSRLTTGRKVLLIGNKATALAEVFARNGVHVVAAISPVNGVKDVPRVMKEVKAHDFDLALVSSGIAAVIIADRIAAEQGKVAIDFGHLADSLVNGEAAFR